MGLVWRLLLLELEITTEIEASKQRNINYPYSCHSYKFYAFGHSQLKPASQFMYARDCPNFHQQQRTHTMNLSAPKQIVFIISLVLAILAVLSVFTTIPFISANAFWTAVVAYALLAAGNLLKGI